MKIFVKAIATRDYTTAYRVGPYIPSDLHPSRWLTEVSIMKGEMYVVEQNTDDPIRYLVLDKKAGRKNNSFVPAEIFMLVIPTVDDLNGEGRWETL